MLDNKFIKENLQAVKENIKNRNMNADADLVVSLYDHRTAAVTELQGWQQKRNENAAAMKQKLDAETRQGHPLDLKPRRALTWTPCWPSCPVA